MKPAKLSDIYDALEPTLREPVRALKLGDVLKFTFGNHYVVVSAGDGCVILSNPKTGSHWGPACEVGNSYRLTRAEVTKLCDRKLADFTFIGQGENLVTVGGV